MKFIPTCKDDEVQVDCYLLLLSYGTNTMCALQGRRGAGRLLPSPSELRHKYNVHSARTTRCRSTATFSFGATPQIQCALCKDNEAQVDYYLLFRSSATNTMCAPSQSARTQVDCNLCSILACESGEEQIDWILHLRAASQALKYIPSEEQSSLEGKCKHIQ